MMDQPATENSVIVGLLSLSRNVFLCVVIVICIIHWSTSERVQVLAMQAVLVSFNIACLF